MTEQRGRKGWTIRAVLSDDAIWHNRNRTVGEWARLVGFHAMSIKQDLIWRGWKRDNKGHVVQAPCATCNLPTDVSELCYRRQCMGCRVTVDQSEMFDPRDMYHAELKRRKERRKALGLSL